VAFILPVELDTRFCCLFCFHHWEQIKQNLGWFPTWCTFVCKGSFLTGAQDSHLQRVAIPEAAYVQLRRRPPEDEQGNARNM